MRRLVALVVAVLTLGALPAAADAPDVGACPAAFPDAVFDTAADAGPVRLWGSGLNVEVTERFARELGDLVGWVGADIAPLDGVEVCLFADDIPIDADALGWYPGHVLPAVAFGADGVVAISAELLRYVRDAAIAGLVHIALWRASDGEYPQPFGDDVMGWYLGRVAGTTEAIHNVFLGQQIGRREPWPPFPWTAGTISDPILWNPQFGYGGAGDFTAFVVAAEGSAYLAAPDVGRLAALDEEWRQALFEASGAIAGGSKGWIVGVIASVVLVAAAVAFAWMGRRSRLRAEAALRAAALGGSAAVAPGPGADGVVRPLSGGGLRRAHPRVGGGGPGAVGGGGDDGDRAPGGGERRARRNRVPKPPKPGDDMFRHPGFRDEG